MPPYVWQFYHSKYTEIKVHNRNTPYMKDGFISLWNVYKGIFLASWKAIVERKQ